MNFRLTGVWGVAAISALQQERWLGHGDQWGDILATCRYIEKPAAPSFYSALVCDMDMTPKA